MIKIRLLNNFHFILIALALSGCSTKPHIVKTTDIKTSKSMGVSIVSHGWHTGFVVPSDTITSRLPQLKERFENSPYLEFGWGDKGFYQSEEITSSLTIRAIFWPTESVVHVVEVPEPAEVYFPDSKIITLCLQSDQYSKLVAFIESSFYKEVGGKIHPTKNGIYGNSQFYKGVGDYYLMNTCNKWTAKGLASTGMDITTTFKLTADSIMDYLSDENIALKYYSTPTRCTDASLAR